MKEEKVKQKKKKKKKNREKEKIRSNWRTRVVTWDLSICFLV